MTKNNVLIMCLADPSGDPRPLRAIELCRSKGFSVSVMGRLPQKPLEGVTYFPLPKLSLSLPHKIARRLFCAAIALSPFEKGKIFWEGLRFGMQGAERLIRGRRFDLLIVEDIQLLPLAFAVRSGARVLFDAREYYPRQNEGELWFEVFEKRRRIQLCRDYIARCDAVVTVSEGLRKEYFREFGITSEVYRSTPSYVDFPFHPTDPDNIRMIYHGAANRNRRLENLIDIFSCLDERFSLDLILTGNPGYQQELRQKAAPMKRIAFPDPVPFEEIIPTIGKYDIGFFYCEPTTFNLQNCLPNKFFEFIQARLMIAIGPSPDMAELVKEYGCGVVSKEFSIQSMARTLNSLSVEDIDRHKQRSDRAARELCFEKESEKMAALLDRMLKGLETE